MRYLPPKRPVSKPIEYVDLSAYTLNKTRYIVRKESFEGFEELKETVDMGGENYSLFVIKFKETYELKKFICPEKIKNECFDLILKDFGVAL